MFINLRQFLTIFIYSFDHLHKAFKNPVTKLITGQLPRIYPTGHIPQDVFHRFQEGHT